MRCIDAVIALSTSGFQGLLRRLLPAQCPSTDRVPSSRPTNRGQWLWCATIATVEGLVRSAGPDNSHRGCWRRGFAKACLTGHGQCPTLTCGHDFSVDLGNGEAHRRARSISVRIGSAVAQPNLNTGAQPCREFVPAIAETSAPAVGPGFERPRHAVFAGTWRCAGVSCPPFIAHVSPGSPARHCRWPSLCSASNPHACPLISHRRRMRRSIRARSRCTTADCSAGQIRRMAAWFRRAHLFGFG